MSDQDDNDAGGAAAPNDTTSKLLAKWLIPSAAILFGIIGYVVQSGQESLLGVQPADHESTAYLNSAADFLRESIVQLLAWLVSWRHDIFLHHPFLMLYAVTAVFASLIGISSKKLRKRFGPGRVAMVAVLMIASAVVLKFLVMDAPLLKIQNLASSDSDSCWALVAQSPSTAQIQGQSSQGAVNCAAMQVAKGVDGWVWREASEITGEIVCSRVPRTTASALPPAIANSQACRQPIEENKRALADEFLCNLFLEIVTICGALAVLSRRPLGSGATAIGLLILLYGLTAPYAYGKVGITQAFDYGDARITSDLYNSYVKEDPHIVSDRGWLPGVMLRKDQDGASLLAMRMSDCPAPLNGKTQPTQQIVSLSFIPNSQLMSFDEINKIDLITWLATHQYRCPGI